MFTQYVSANCLEDFVLEEKTSTAVARPLPHIRPYSRSGDFFVAS